MTTSFPVFNQLISYAAYTMGVDCIIMCYIHYGCWLYYHVLHTLRVLTVLSCVTYTMGVDCIIMCYIHYGCWL